MIARSFFRSFFLFSGVCARYGYWTRSLAIVIFKALWLFIITVLLTLKFGRQGTKKEKKRRNLQFTSWPRIVRDVCFGVSPGSHLWSQREVERWHLIFFFSFASFRSECLGSCSLSTSQSRGRCTFMRVSLLQYIAESCTCVWEKHACRRLLKVWVVTCFNWLIYCLRAQILRSLSWTVPQWSNF